MNSLNSYLESLIKFRKEILLMHSIWLHYFLLLVSVFIYGCSDTNEHNNVVNKSKANRERSYDHYVLPKEVVKKVKKKLKIVKRFNPPNINEKGFPDVKYLILERKVALLRGSRRSKSKIHKTKKVTDNINKIKMKKYEFEDKNYSDLGENISTFPVKRNRILTSDMRITAILEDAVNSQIPGRIIAIVDRDILSPTMDYVLIPAYTKFICMYEGLHNTEQTRLPVKCIRAIRPDGVSIILTNAISADMTGKMGLVGKVNSKSGKRYATALMLSAISAVSRATYPRKNNKKLHIMSHDLYNRFGEMSSKILVDKLDLKPTISIPAGTRIQIIPTTDIYFKEVIEVIEQNKEVSSEKN